MELKFEKAQIEKKIAEEEAHQKKLWKFADGNGGETEPAATKWEQRCRIGKRTRME